MNFAGALFALKRYHKVKRHHWTGYWHAEARVDGKPDDIFMHTWDGKEIKLTDTNDIFYTLSNCACDDWEIVEDWDKNTTQPDYMNDNCVTEENHCGAEMDEEKKK